MIFISLPGRHSTITPTTLIFLEGARFNRDSSETNAFNINEITHNSKNKCRDLEYCKTNNLETVIGRACIHFKTLRNACAEKQDRTQKYVSAARNLFRVNSNELVTSIMSVDMEIGDERSFIAGRKGVSKVLDINQQN